MLAPPPPNWWRRLELRPVGALVGNVANDDPSLVDPVAECCSPELERADADLTCASDVRP